MVIGLSNLRKFIIERLNVNSVLALLFFSSTRLNCRYLGFCSLLQEDFYGNDFKVCSYQIQSTKTTTDDDT